MTHATFARLQRAGGDGSPDPRTATCPQHVVAAPYSDTARSDSSQAVDDLDWECVVCPLPDADLIGTEVIALGYVGSTFVYGGPGEHRFARGYTSVAYSMRGGPNVIRGDVTCVAPAATVLDLKDPRISVTKLLRKRDYQDFGLWVPAIEHPVLSARSPRGRKTKRDAIAWAALQLAITVYHEERSAVTATK